MTGDDQDARRNDELVKEAARRFPFVRYVQGAVAILVVGQSVILAFHDIATAVTLLGVLVLFGLVLLIAERSRGRRKTLDRAGDLLIWTTTGVASVLILAGGAYFLMQMFAGDEEEVPTHSAMELEVNRLKNVYSGLRGDWEAAVGNANDPGWPSIATRAGHLVNDFVTLEDDGLSPLWEIYKYRFMGASGMIACHAAHTLGEKSADKSCADALDSSSRAAVLAAEAEKSGQEAEDWIRRTRQADKIQCEIAFENAMLFARTGDERHVTAACCAVARMSPEHRRDDSPETSTVIAPILPRCSAVTSC